MNSTLESAWNDVASQLRGYIRTRVSDHATAEDLLQDVYVKAHTRIADLPAHSNVQAWLFQISKNAVIDHYRKTKPSEPVDESMPADPFDPDSAEVERLKQSFHRMIASLPEPYREAITLTDIEGLTQKELSERLGISLSGAKSRVQRGRQILKKDLMECCEFEFDRRGKIIDYKPKTECCLEETTQR